MPSTDPDFLHYSVTGDAAAFQSMVAAHLPMVLATAGRKLGPHSHLAQDVAQSVFTRLARVARGLPDDLVVAPWLHRQTIRLAIDTVRKEERRRRRETTAAMLQSPDSSPAAAPHSPISHLLDEALDQLPASDRSLLVIHYLEGRDSTDMAQTLGSTPAAIRQRISRSLAKLRDLLTRRGVSLSITALAGYLTAQNSSAAPATLVTSISASALRSAALASSTTASLTTALMSHATALTTGALAALLACGLLYQQRETEIARRTATSGEKAADSLSSALPRQLAPDPDSIPRTLPEIIEAIKTLTDGPDTRVSQERIARLLRHVPPEQYLEFYIAAESCF